MNITILSSFRNATRHIDRYFTQIDALAACLARRGDRLNLQLGYGDSTDGTSEMLFESAACSIGAVLHNVTHGGAEYGSIEHPQRFKQLAYVGNRLLATIPPDADVVGIVESDLIWDAMTMLRLIDHLRDVPAVAPMIMDGPDSFYDVFAFRRDGQRFTKTPPYHAVFSRGDDLVQLDSAGSVLWMRGDLARVVRCTEDEVIVGLCEDINAHAGSIWLDSRCIVHHPIGVGETMRYGV